jgi:twitching motility protein PilI
MANREALRELQTRLANRLQAAQSEGLSVAWLAVRAGGKNFLFPLGQSGEIFPLSQVQAVPYVKEWFRGVINVRGSLLGVVSLAAFLDSEQGAVSGHAPITPITPIDTRAETGVAAKASAASSEASVVTLNELLEVNCALVVDSLAGLRGGDAFHTAVQPAADAPLYFGNCFTDAEGGQWQEINLRALAQLPRFLNISA